MKTLLLIAILITICSTCYASSLEFAQMGDNSQVKLCVEQSLSKNTSAFLFALNSKSWSEAYVGLTYSPVPEVQFALGAGQETGGNRVGGWIWAGKGRISAIYLFEDGFTGPWAKTIVKYAVNPKVSLGYVKKDFAGEGIYAEYKLGKDATLKYSGFKTPELAMAVSF